MIKSEPAGRVIAMVKILESDVETSSFTFIFNEGVSPSIQYKEVPEPHKRFFSRKASEEELADFRDILKQPLYLSGSSR